MKTTVRYMELGNDEDANWKMIEDFLNDSNLGTTYVIKDNKFIEVKQPLAKFFLKAKRLFKRL